MIEIFDRMAQFLEYIFLPLAVAGDIGNRPHGISRIPLCLCEPAYPQPQPATVRAVGGGNAHLFLLAFALARRLQKAEYRLGNVGITNEYPFHRSHVLHRRSSG